MYVIEWGALPQFGILSAFNRTAAEASPRKLADRLEGSIIPTDVYGKQFQTPHETISSIFIGCLPKSFSQNPNPISRICWWHLREHVWEYQSMCASGSLRFRSKVAGRFPLGCGSIVQSPWKSFWREPWNLHTPQKWPKYHIIYGSRNESRHSVYEQAMNKTPSSQHCLTLEEFLKQYRLATPASQKTRSITPDATNDRLENSQFTSAGKTATSLIGQNYTPADSRTPLLALRTCPSSSFWGFLEINFFEFFHSTMLKYGQSHTCAGKHATPRRLLSNFYSNTTPKAAEQSVVLTLTRKSSGDHLSLQTTSFSLRHQ